MSITVNLLSRFLYAGKYKWKRPFRNPIELYRCQSDNCLLTDKMCRNGYCAGHQIRQPATPTLFELFLIYIGVVR